MSRKRYLKISDVLGNLGFAFEFFKVIADACVTRGGTMQHLRRVVSDRTLQDQLAILIVPPAKPIGENEYLVPVTYAALPSFVELEKEFGKGNVSDLFDGRAFQKHASCTDIDETPGNKIFLLEHFNRKIMSEDAIAEMDKHGYRPATHLEIYSFQKAHPDLQRQFWVVALGSFATVDDGCCVTMLLNDSDGRFGDGWFDVGWDSDCRFLFVRKDS